MRAIPRTESSLNPLLALPYALGFGGRKFTRLSFFIRLSSGLGGIFRSG